MIYHSAFPSLSPWKPTNGTDWWTPLASEIIDSDPPGVASNDLITFDYKHKTRKVYPLDKDAVYPEPAK